MAVKRPPLFTFDASRARRRDDCAALRAERRVGEWLVIAAVPEKKVAPKGGELNFKAFDRALKLMGEVGTIPTPVWPVELVVDPRYLRSAGMP